MRPTPERTLEYGTNSREDLYKMLYTVLTNHMPLADVPGYSALDMGQKRGIKAALDNFADVIVQLAFMSSMRDGQINPVHRPVIEQLVTDLQAMLDAMPAKEKPSTGELEDSTYLAKKTWACPDHGIRPWQSRPGVLRGWCHKELADGTECGHELVERTKPEGMFHMA